MPNPPDSDAVRRLVSMIESFGAHAGRTAGSEAERTCQAAMAGRLHDLGLDAVVQSAVTPPAVSLVLGLHAAFFLASALLVVVAPAWALLASAVTLLSFWGELRERPRILQKLLLKRITGNMVARRANPDARAQVVLVAHADVATSSVLFQPWVKRFILHREVAGRGVHPGSLVIVAGGVQILAAAVVWAGGGLWLGPAIGLTFASIVHAGLLVLAIDWWRAPAAPGAVDNGSGLAVALAVAEELTRDPLPHAELWVVASGAREPEAAGMSAFVRQFEHLLDRERTFFVNIDDVGQGKLHFVTSEGRWERLSYRPTLPGLAEQLAAHPPFLRVAPTEVVGTTDAGPPTVAGYRAVTLSSLVAGKRPEVTHTHEDTLDAIDPASLVEALEFTLALCRSIDRFAFDALPPWPKPKGVTTPGRPAKQVFQAHEPGGDP